MLRVKRLYTFSTFQLPYNLASITHCIQYFHRFKYKCEYKVKFVRGEDEEEASFTIENSYRNLFEPNQEQNEFDADIQEYEQGESVFSFDGIINFKKI